MAYRLRHPNDVAEELRRIVAEQVDRALAASGEESRSADDRVHEVRTRIKKIRAVLRLAKEAADPAWYKQENGDYRAIARRLGNARDAAVMAATFEQLIRQGPRPLRGEAITAIRLALKPKRADVTHHLADTVHALRDAWRRIASWTFRGESFAVIAPGLCDTYRRGRKTMTKAVASHDVEDLHDWRKRVKNNMHQLTLLRDIDCGMIAAQRDELSALGSALGEDHDLWMLKQAMASLALPVPASLARRLAARRAALHGEVARLGSCVYAEKPNAFLARIRACWLHVNAI